MIPFNIKICGLAVQLGILGLAMHSMASSFTVPASEPYRLVEFAWRSLAGTNTATGVLLLIPGFNGSGAAMLGGRWAQFADECGLLLLAPTFHSNVEELHRREGYYYPELWSGAVIEQALAEVARRERINTDKILIFGFSAGAHVAHRFALWKPDRVKAFVAYSAAWWDPPTEKLRDVPALIMCGEQDERLGATREFFERGLKLDLPFVWRAYRGVGHQMTPAVQRMAEAFLRHYAFSAKSEPQVGDVQTYRFVPTAQSNEIPSAVRIVLPSRAVAEAWAKEE
jgi:pimeloyl-ACP methyl ester carboxylesterase